MGQNIKIMVRIRPMLSIDDQPIWMLKDNSLTAIQSNKSIREYSNENISMNKEKRKEGSKHHKDVYHEFHFQNIVQEYYNTQHIFKTNIRATLLDCSQYYRNLSIIAYGQTCSGKTHTILGVKEAPGIIPCVFRELFLIKKSKKCLFKMSYIQIYNEKLRDLLDKKEKPMKISQDQKWGCQITNSQKLSFTSFEQGLKILQRGQKQRQYGNGQYHERSSRSHTLLRIFIQQWDSNLISRSFTITIVDLAGSERLNMLEQSNHQTGYINKSLFQLSNCIYKLSQNAGHIPFRDSKLTKILEPSLVGHGRSLLICCIAPSKQCFSQSLSTLRLAQRAKRIQLKEQPELPSQKQYEKIVQKLRLKERQCTDLKNQINKLSFQIQNLSEELSYQKNNKNSQKIKAKLIILLDHQNASLFFQKNIQKKSLENENYRLLKEQFRDKLQFLYEQYTKQIITRCLHDKPNKIKVQIDEICFMNMILQHQKIIQYKLNVISALLEEKNHVNQGDLVFYEVLEKYMEELMLINNVAGGRSDFQSKSNHKSGIKYLDSIDFTSKRSKNELNNQTIQFNSVQKVMEQQFGNGILTWGSKKDHRVCRGSLNHLGMTKITSLIDVKLISCGYHHTFAITKEGMLYGWGKNTEKQIIDVQKDSIASPTLIKDIKRVKEAVGGWGHSLILTYDGEIYTWGYGNDGQLGHNSKESYKKPTKIEIQSYPVNIFAGHSHSAYLDSSGNLYTFGFNHDYRLMIGDQKQVLYPKKIAIKDITAVSLGVSHSAVITSSGLVFCGGTGTNGQLGVSLDQHITGWQRLDVADKQFEVINYEKICPIIQVEKFNAKSRAKKVRCGQNMTIVLTEKGEVYTFGKALSGRLGHNKQSIVKVLQNIDDIECGCRNGLAYSKRQNKLYSWGFNIYGQSNPSTNTDIQQPLLIQNISDSTILKMSSGYFHTAILFK